MPLRRPTEKEISRIATQWNLDLSEHEIEVFSDLVDETLDLYDVVRSLGEPSYYDTTPRKRTSGQRVRPEENRHNAWVTKCQIEGEDDGPLSGWDIALKDNIPVSGVEMTCGSELMEGYVPNIDAPVVTRLLDAGGRVVGKTNMDDMAFSGDGYRTAFGPVRNPHDDDHLAGGSSGGSAVVVAKDEVDVALGTDQGGSIRAPSSWCGVVGLKPTFGLVPYTGMTGLEPTIDHVGPLASDVETAARTLSVIAGKNPHDPRQPPELPTEDYAAKLTGDPSQLSVAVVEEGFDMPGAESGVNNRVRNALDSLSDAGATVDEVSIPLHENAQAIQIASIAEAVVATVMGEGMGHAWKGWYNTQWVESFGKFRSARGDALPPGFKLVLLVGTYTSQRFQSRYYTQAMNLRLELEEAYDEVLAEYDLLAMPTTPMVAHEYSPNKDLYEWFDDAWVSLASTCAFNMTGHPAISVPAGTHDGLPVGLMFVGDQFDDATVLDAAKAIEEKVA